MSSAQGEVAGRPQSAVLVLGGGINGCAVARELLLNRVPVWLVDAHDLAFGATSRSSRLIHGGLRYLEYGNVRLVRESLEERSRLRRLAPQFVEPLRLYIPVSNRLGGVATSILRLLRAERSARLGRIGPRVPAARGLWLARTGLWLYDRLAREAAFPTHRVHALDDASVPAVDPRKYRWLCAYTDARMLYPERFVVALLEDARRLAAEHQTELRVFTYHRVSLDGTTVRIRRRNDVVGVPPDPTVHKLRAAVIVNTTGAWGDQTLSDLHVASPQLFGGTKGSHFITFHHGLREALRDGGVYAEASDGRLVFVLPFGEAVLVGTTDVRFDGPPERAVATPAELDYLLDMVNHVFPQVGLTADDIDLHYSGVRPLPHVKAGHTGSITRGHAVETNESGPIPVLTLVGGKLTTCRVVAEQLADHVLERLGQKRLADSRDRPLPGGAGYPADTQALARERHRLAERLGLDIAQVRAMWSLCGNCVEPLWRGLDNPDRRPLPGTELPMGFVRHVIESEAVTTLSDLVERRLMLLYRPALPPECLERLADCLIEAGRLEASFRDAAVQATADRLQRHYGKRWTPPS